jgi:predicted TIM-barrel fold metal-dependent hydrolase
VVVAFPPVISNESVFQVCAGHPNLIPAVQVDKRAKDIPGSLQAAYDRGARLLKFHPLADGFEPDCESYRQQLEFASEHQMLILLHTGVIHARGVFPKPELGHVRRFLPWFEKYRHLTFVLAHLGFHESKEVLQAALQNKNTRVLTSWQPTEIIAQAVRELGVERVLYASDWPLFGENMRVGLARIRQAVVEGLLTQDEINQILGGNAQTLLQAHQAW